MPEISAAVVDLRIAGIALWGALIVLRTAALYLLMNRQLICRSTAIQPGLNSLLLFRQVVAPDVREVLVYDAQFALGRECKHLRGAAIANGFVEFLAEHLLLPYCWRASKTDKLATAILSVSNCT